MYAQMYVVVQTKKKHPHKRTRWLTSDSGVLNTFLDLAPTPYGLLCFPTILKLWVFAPPLLVLVFLWVLLFLENHQFTWGYMLTTVYISVPEIKLNNNLKNFFLLLEQLISWDRFPYFKALSSVGFIMRMVTYQCILLNSLLLKPSLSL